MCQSLPKVTRDIFAVSTDYTLISGLPIVLNKQGAYRISAYHSYTHAVPQGLIISRSSTDCTASINVLAKAETTSDVAELSVSINSFSAASTAINYYLWAKSKTANSNQMGVIIEYLG